MSGKNFFGDRYRKIGILGKGATSIVYHAKDVDLNRNVSIKIPKPSVITHNNIFKKEAKYLASLDHPNVIPLYEYYQSSNGPVLVMRYVESNLFNHIRYKKYFNDLPIERITSQIALALDFCRANGIAHRDIKPDNILIDMSGHTYLTDFGIAAKLDDLKEWTQPVGNPAYISPELLLGKKISDNYEKSDQFSFGVTIYQLITGKLPHCITENEKHHFTSLKLIKGERTIPCFEHNPFIPTSVNDVLSKMMSVNPDNRYSSNQDAVNEFCEYYSGRRKVIKAFVCFSHKDQKLVEFLTNELEKNEISVWWDNNIEHGQYWDDRIEEEMISSDVMLVFISPESARSKEAKNEWRYWLDYFDKPLIPIMISECRPPYRLSSIQRISAIDKEVKNVAIEIAAAIKISLKKQKKTKYEVFGKPVETIKSTTQDEKEVTNNSSSHISLDIFTDKYLSENLYLNFIDSKEFKTEIIYIPKGYRIDQSYIQTFLNKEDLQDHIRQIMKIENK